MTDILTFIESRAASYGAVRKSALTAIALDQAADEIARLRARVSELERTCVEAVIPLEAMTISGATTGMSLELRQGIHRAISAVRSALSSKDSPND